MILQEMQELKTIYGLSYKDISQKSGVSMGTVQKVFGGITSPRAKTLEELSKAFEGLEMPKRDGEYTVEDYESLPEDVRAELIDGKLFKMEAPSNVHQTIILEMAMQLKTAIKKKKGPCKVIVAPSDVELDEGEATIVQPDLYIVCNKDKLKDTRRTHGAPDFIAEIISMSTRIKDKRLKHYKYADAGVREYWIIDPYHESITKYDFENDDMVSIYSFDDIVPLSIYNGNIRVKFSDIKAELIDSFGDSYKKGGTLHEW